jgi:hypothetical protein
MLNPSNSLPKITLPLPLFRAEGVVSSASSKIALAALLLLGGCFLAPARAQAPAAPTPSPLANLRPALANVQTAIGAINIARWKAPNDIRGNSQQDVASMQRDLSTTLPDLMAKAEAAGSGPGALSPTFAVFRNVDALYDVLLRVSQTAALTGSSSDANLLEEARAGLEDGRGKLGTWLLQAIGAQDAQLAHPQPAVAAPVAAPAPPNKIIVEDGPTPTKPRKKKPAATPAPQ